MTAIIKAHAPQPVRPFVVPIDSSSQMGPPAIDPAQEERAALSAEVAQLRKHLDELREGSKSAIARAYAEGRESGLKEAARDEQGRCAALEKGMINALRAWEQRLIEIEGLAALVARTALAKLFSDPAKLCEFVVSAIRRQLQQISHETIVALRVSQTDFPDEATVAALSGQIGGSIQIVVCPDLSTGECLFDLQLGQADISPLSQWRAMESVLTEVNSLEPAQ